MAAKMMPASTIVTSSSTMLKPRSEQALLGCGRTSSRDGHCESACAHLRAAEL